MSNVNTPKRAILVGLGSWGEWWCKYFLPPNIEEGLVEVAAVVAKHMTIQKSGVKPPKAKEIRFH